MELLSSCAAHNESRDVINNAKLITMISGSIGIEAIMMKKPVLHFGNIPFNMLPDSMILQAMQQEKLGYEIADLMQNHCHDEDALISYISAVMKNSVPVDFYSRLLGRKNVIGADDGDTNTIKYKEHIGSLADYIINVYLSEYGN